MSNLTPVQRVNKLGHTVTKHVRNTPAATTLKAMIPPPAKRSSSTRRKPTGTGAYKPTAGQKDAFSAHFFLARYKTDPRLREELEHTIEPKSANEYSWKTSDVEAYEMLSILSVPDAVALGCYGVNTKEAVLEFLSEHGLDDLVTDNSALADMALRRRVHFYDLCDGVRIYGEKTSDPVKLLDATIAHSSATLQKVRLAGRSIEERILNGEVSMSEIETVGVSCITHSNMAARVIDALGSVHQGKADMTAEQVKDIITKFNSENTLSETGVAALDIAERFGAKFVLGLDSLRSTAGVYGWMHRDGKTPGENFVKDMIEYNDAMDRARVRPKYAAIMYMYRSGMPAGTAAQLLAEGRTPADVINIRKEGIHNDLAEGWL